MGTHSPVIRAIDAGYGNVKFVVNPNIWSSNSCQLFPSIALPHVHTDPCTDSMNERDTVIVQIGDEHFEVGPDVHLLEGTRASARILHEDYTTTRQYRALIHGALLRMGVAEIDLMVVGLPVKLMADKRDRLRHSLKGRHRIGDTDVSVADVLVLPQPLGSLIYHIKQKNLFHTITDGACLIIDQGFFTTDWLVVQGLKPMPARCSSSPTGVSALLKKIARDLVKHTGTPFEDLYELDKGLHTGHFRLFGKPFDLSPLITSAKQVFAPLVAELVNTVGSAGNIDRILLTGGGAGFIKDSIQEAFPRHELTLIHDAAFANVKGFQQAGLDLLARRKFSAKGAV